MNNYYFFSKNLKKCASSGLWQSDDLLAHKAVPYATGAYKYYIGDSIEGEVAVCFDKNGYRTLPQTIEIDGDEINLFLGCSNTFGDYINAENSYPYLVSKSLKNKYINAGASAYGFGQMIQLIDSLLPRNKFKYVFIQLSPWLASRSMKLLGPSSYGYRPYPYFSDHRNGFKLNFPAFKTRRYYRKNWRDGNTSYSERLRFYVSDAFMIEVLDYYSYLWAKFKIVLGLIEEPTSYKEKLEQYFYNYAIKTCMKHGSKPIILKLRYPKEDCKSLLDFVDKTQVIDLDFPLDSIVDETNLDYATLFSIYHKHGSDSILYDDHSNNYANRFFANKIIDELR